LQRAVWVFLLSSAALGGSAGFAASNTEVTLTGPDPSYRKVVATHLKEVLKNPLAYDSFEISDPRW
jgi:hypothetical protein